MLHRGRIQAQGEDLEESESWAADTPPTWQEGIEMINKLEDKISKKEAELRKEAFEKARNFVVKAGENGGVNAVVQKTLVVKDTKEERVDIEVRKGKAFI